MGSQDSLVQLMKSEGGPDGDGQYHHYQTIWLFALNRMSVASQHAPYNDDAIALAKAIHPRFFDNVESTAPRMYWKIAMDMSRPLVAGEGNTDALDGYVVYSLLAAGAKDPQCLATEIADYRRVIDRKGQHLVSHDMLDLGMSLWLAQWGSAGNSSAQQLGTRCIERFDDIVSTGSLEGSFRRRIAFRDFGAMLGLRCYLADQPKYELQIHQLLEKWEHWMDTQPEDLQAINQVMYAAALIPGAFQKDYFGQELRVETEAISIGFPRILKVG
ncbi:MAG: hypothetical protein Q9226_007002 [Calogaya cf. arnoldii]